MPTKSSKNIPTPLVGVKPLWPPSNFFSGKGESTVNKIEVSKYFPTTFIYLDKPFIKTDTLNKYYFEAKIVGGGKEGQREALTLALSRALKIINVDYTAPSVKQVF